MKKPTLPLPEKLYNLIPSQQTMYMMVKYSFHKQLIQIPVSFTVKKDLDLKLLQKAFNMEIARNDCLRLRFLKTDSGIKQYFAPLVSMDVPVMHFSSLEEQEAFFSKDAQKPVFFLKNETFRIIFFKTDGVGTGIYFNTSHMIMDALAIVIMFYDLLRVYKSLATGCEMPQDMDPYEDYINEEFARLSNVKKMKKHQQFYIDYFLKHGEPGYAGVHGSAFLEKSRKKMHDPNLRVPKAYNPLYSKCNMITKTFSPETAQKVLNYCMTNRIAPESLLELALRTHCSAVNNRTPDVFFQTICCKRATKKEKNMCGCLAQAIQLRTVIPEDYTFAKALDVMTDTRTQLFRHSDYPYGLALDISKKLFNFSLTQGPASMMFSWLPVPINENIPFEFDFRGYSMGYYYSPLYCISHPDPKTKSIKINYMYRTKLSSKEDIERLHRNTEYVLSAGIDNPDITIKELLDNIQ